MPGKKFPQSKAKFHPNAHLVTCSDDCQRRKIKCSGEGPCHNCRLRDIECRFSSTVDGVQQKSKVSRRRRPHHDSSSSDTTRSHEINTDDGDDNDEEDKSSRNLRRKRARHSHNTSPTTPLPTTTSATGGVAGPWFQLLQENILHQLEQRLCEKRVNNNSRHPEAAGGKDAPGIGTATPKRLDIATLLDPDTQWQSPHAIGALIKTMRSEASREALFHRTPPPFAQRTIRLCVPQDAFASVIQLCFNEIDGYFPYLIADRPGLQARIQSALCDSRAASSDGSGIIIVNASHHHVIALSCAMVAMGLNSPRALAASRDDGAPIPNPRLSGQKLYVESRKLVDHFEGAMPATLELLWYHVIAVAWMSVLGNWRLASYHVAQGLHTRLNMPAMDKENDNQAQAEVEHAWCTLRHFDKRISQVAGTPHVIRPQYCSTESSVAHSALRSDNCLQFTTAQGIITSVLDHDELWETMWDQFLAPNAPKADDWTERRAFDSKIVASQQLLPSELGWTTSSMLHLQDEDEWELSLSRRLAIQLRYQQLRMKLWRRIELASNLEQYRSQQCFEIVQQVTEAISTYMMLGPSPLAGLGLHLTIALIEAIYHIITEARNPASHIGPDRCDTVLQVASELLYKLTDSHIVAQHACQMLSGVLKYGQEPNAMEDSIRSEAIPMHDNFPMRAQTSPIPNQKSLLSWDSNNWNTPGLTSVITTTSDQSIDFDIATSMVDPALSFEPHVACPSADVISDLTPDELSNWLTDAGSIWER